MLNTFLCSVLSQVFVFSFEVFVKFQLHLLVFQIVSDNVLNCLSIITVTGCPDPVTNVNTWARREHSKVTLGCKNSDDQWTAICENNVWKGKLENCSMAGEYCKINYCTSVMLQPLCYFIKSPPAKY